MPGKESSAVQFEKLLDFLHTSRGFDFSSYKRTTLQRRVQKRMVQVGVDSYGSYLDFLEVHQGEFQSLFNTILINVTSFFRDPEAWDYFSDEAVKPMLEAKESGEPIRAWVAGCASGEEAYSLAMLITDAVGETEFRDRVKIYATDLDEDALNSSRFASYTSREVEAVPKPFLEKYFEASGDRWVFDRDLRRSVIFGRHDLLRDAPISKVDLLLCRNTLMYFNAEAQGRILSRFNFALAEGGYLFLGRAETLLSHSNLFVPIDPKNRVFRKVPPGPIRDRVFMFANGYVNGPTQENLLVNRLRDTAFDLANSAAQIVIDSNGRLVAANERARIMFSLTPRDLGKPIQDLQVSYRPTELRSGIEQASTRRRPVVHKDIAWTAPSGEPRTLEMSIVPLFSESNEQLGTSVSFEDTTQIKRLQAELINFNQELETAYEEVQSTNEELQTTNEELQSTVEELETTNEELQSTNEELETMNEELQSANVELETINQELRLRSQELNRANSFLESILDGLRDGVIVIDADLKILAWNPSSTNTWGLRGEETVGKYLLNLDFGLPVEKLRAPIRACLATCASQNLSLSALNRRGRALDCQVVLTPLISESGDPEGVIIHTLCRPIDGKS